MVEGNGDVVSSNSNKNSCQNLLQWKEKIVTPPSLGFILAFGKYAFGLLLQLCTAVLGVECLCLHGDSSMPRNAVEREACRGGFCMDGSGLSGCYESEINYACITIQACT